MPIANEGLRFDSGVKFSHRDRDVANIMVKAAEHVGSRPIQVQFGGSSGLKARSD